MPAFAYLRKSSVRNDDPGLSPEAQEEAVRRLAERRGDGADLVILSDWDKSGRLGPDKRPGYRALLEAIESGDCTAVYSYSLSRLGRSVTELSRLITDCDKRGIPVRLDADNIDTSTASGRLTANVLGSVAQFEAEVASERVHAANAAKLARGVSLRSVPLYGDRAGEDTDKVLAAFREAGSYSGAARLLNERGIRPRSAKPRQVRRRDGTAHDQKQAIWWPSSVAVVVQRLDPSLVVGPSTRGGRAGGSDFLLARLLRCPTCGTRLTGTRDREGRRVRYSCRLGSVTPHARVSVSEHLILPAIRDELARLRPPAKVEASADRAARARIDAQRTRVRDMYQDGDLDRAERRRRLDLIDKAAAKLDAKRTILAVPAIDWDADMRDLNGLLQRVFADVTLDPMTFQPIAFDWVVPEWRRP